MADLLSVQEIADLKEAFAVFDKDGDGSVTIADLADVFRSVGHNVSHDQLLAMIGDADMDSNGVVDFTEFLSLVARRLTDGGEQREGELRATFAQFDLGGTGFISASNLQVAMAKLGCRLTVEEADEMIREADIDGDGRLSYEDFCRIMRTAE